MVPKSGCDRYSTILTESKDGPWVRLTKSGDRPSDNYTDQVWRRPSNTYNESGDSPSDTYIDWVWRRPLGLILPPPWGWHEGWWGPVSVQGRLWWYGRREETWCGGPVVHGGPWWELLPQTGGWKRVINHLISMSNRRLNIRYSLYSYILILGSLCSIKCKGMTFQNPE